MLEEISKKPIPGNLILAKGSTPSVSDKYTTDLAALISSLTLVSKMQDSGRKSSSMLLATYTSCMLISTKQEEKPYE